MPRASLWVPMAVAICSPAVAHATQYLTLAQAQRALFPAASSFDAAGIPAAWKAVQGPTLLGHVMVDEVIGKHELITYAVGIAADGTLLGVEVLDYRETRGGEIRDPRWRAQFAGKRVGSTLRLGDDIQNITGATLSCRHVTEGVKRLLAVHAAKLKDR